MCCQQNTKQELHICVSTGVCNGRTFVDIHSTYTPGECVSRKHACLKGHQNTSSTVPLLLRMKDEKSPFPYYSLCSRPYLDKLQHDWRLWRIAFHRCWPVSDRFPKGHLQLITRESYMAVREHLWKFWCLQMSIDVHQFRIGITEPLRFARNLNSTICFFTDIGDLINMGEVIFNKYASALCFT